MSERTHPMSKTVSLDAPLPEDSGWTGTRHTVWKVRLTKRNYKPNRKKDIITVGYRVTDLTCPRCERGVYKIYFNDGRSRSHRRYVISHVDQDSTKLKECYMLKMLLEGAKP